MKSILCRVLSFLLLPLPQILPLFFSDVVIKASPTGSTTLSMFILKIKKGSIINASILNASMGYAATTRPTVVHAGPTLYTRPNDSSKRYPRGATSPPPKGWSHLGGEMETSPDHPSAQLSNENVGSLCWGDDSSSKEHVNFTEVEQITDKSSVAFQQRAWEALQVYL